MARKRAPDQRMPPQSVATARLKRRRANLQKIRAKYKRVDYYPCADAQDAIHGYVARGHTLTGAIDELIIRGTSAFYTPTDEDFRRLQGEDE